MRALTSLLLAGVLVAGGGEEAAARGWSGCFAGPVTRVQFESAGRVDARSLRALVLLRPGEVPSAATLAESKRRLELKNLWSSVEFDCLRQGDGVEVVFHLEPKARIRALRIAGARSLPVRTLMRRLRIGAGTVAEGPVLDAAAERLREFYAAEGFAAAAVRVRTRRQPANEVDVVFEVTEGRPTVIARIVLQGELAFPAAEVRAALGIPSRARYTRKVERAARTRLLGFYRQRQRYAAAVTTQWVRGTGAAAGVLRVRVYAGPPYELVFKGNRVLSDRELAGLVDLERRPIITDGTWRELARRIAKAYRERGYYQVEVDMRMENTVPRRVVFAVAEGKRLLVEKVDFAGNVSVPAAKLLAVMETRPRSWFPWRRGGVFTDEVFAEDLRRIASFYHRLGFEAAEVADSRVEIDPAASSIVLAIEIDEGLRSIVRSVELEGFAELAQLPVLKNRVELPYDPATVESDRATLTAAVAHLGYPLAEVKAQIERVRAAGGIDIGIRFAAVPGPFRRVGPVIVRGNWLTCDRVIMRALPFREGQAYDPEALLRGQARVYRLGLFRRVTVRPLEADDAPAAAVSVEVEERAPGTLQYGLGYDTDLGFRAFGELGYENLQGMARRISLRAELNLDPGAFSPDEYFGNLGFRAPRLLGTSWVSRINFVAQRSKREVDRFDLERLSVVAAVERQLHRRLTTGIEVEVDQSKVFGVAEDAVVIDDDEGFLRTTSVVPFLVLDRRDDSLAPRAGTFDAVRLRYSSPWLGSDVHFAKLTLQHSHFLPLPGGPVLAYALRAGWALPLDGARTVPIRDRMFLGGRTSVRGFDENSIGPQGEAGSPKGGDLAANLNLELRFPLWFGFGGVAFLDGGGVYLRREAVSVHDFRRSAGVGLRYKTPLGPVSFDYGFKLDRRAGEPIGALHFTVGAIF